MKEKGKSWLDKYIRDFGGLLRQFAGGAVFYWRRILRMAQKTNRSIRKHI